MLCVTGFVLPADHAGATQAVEDILRVLPSEGVVAEASEKLGDVVIHGVAPGPLDQDGSILEPWVPGGNRSLVPIHIERLDLHADNINNALVLDATARGGVSGVAGLGLRNCVFLLGGRWMVTCPSSLPCFFP